MTFLDRALRSQLKSIFPFLPVAAVVTACPAPVAAISEVQATPKNTKTFIHGVCMNGVNDHGREMIAKRGKTLLKVCDCTTARMWEKFPSIHFWVQETTPYERNQVVAEFPKALTACIVE